MIRFLLTTVVLCSSAHSAHLALRANDYIQVTNRSGKDLVVQVSFAAKRGVSGRAGVQRTYDVYLQRRAIPLRAQMLCANGAVQFIMHSPHSVTQTNRMIPFFIASQGFEITVSDARTGHIYYTDFVPWTRQISRFVDKKALIDIVAVQSGLQVVVSVQRRERQRF